MKIKLLAISAILGALVLVQSAFVVNEWEQAFTTRFGKVTGKAETEPGLYFKLPFVDMVHRFEKRILEWESSASQMQDVEKRYIVVGAYARWRITDPVLFYERIRDEQGARTRLDDGIDGAIRTEVAKHRLIDVVRSEQREAEVEDDTYGSDSKLLDFRLGRELITQSILARAKERTSGWGIELIDVQIKLINLEPETEAKTMLRMSSERQRIAEKLRSEGQGELQRISGEKERDLKEIMSRAYREKQKIEGDADAIAARIYSEAYDADDEARELYRLTKKLETYQKTITNSDTLLLSTEGDLFDLFKRED
ncbi:MAG: protease modulator HflC [Limisphaerales bacterium]|jgi:membrane protease subunit HflC|nr:protease modulator HflC [Verrucomicrobiota bacterium]